MGYNRTNPGLPHMPEKASVSFRNPLVSVRRAELQARRAVRRASSGPVPISWHTFGMFKPSKGEPNV